MLRPEHDWEGADAPLEPSVRSTAYGHVNQLRDPAIFEDADSGRVFLLYAVAGESGIAIAEVHLGGRDSFQGGRRQETEGNRWASPASIQFPLAAQTERLATVRPL